MVGRQMQTRGRAFLGQPSRSAHHTSPNDSTCRTTPPTSSSKLYSLLTGPLQPCQYFRYLARLTYSQPLDIFKLGSLEVAAASPCIMHVAWPIYTQTVQGNFDQALTPCNASGGIRLTLAHDSGARWIGRSHTTPRIEIEKGIITTGIP